MAPTVAMLEAELAGEERAIRHLIGERAALTSQIQREQAREKLLKAQIATTRGHPAVRPPGTVATIPHGARFPDVSNFQPSVTWQAVAAGASVRTGLLGVTKLSEGLHFVDAFGRIRLDHMRGVKIPHRGGYAFLHPSESGAAQAEHFLSSGGAELGPADVAIADVEVSDGASAGAVARCAADFARTVSAHSRAKRWLYGGGPFLHEHGVPLQGYDAHWLAAYVGNPFPFMVYGRGRTIAWQYTDGRLGPVPHVCPGVGPCDMSIIL